MPVSYADRENVIPNRKADQTPSIGNGSQFPWAWNLKICRPTFLRIYQENEILRFQKEKVLGFS